MSRKRLSPLAATGFWASTPRGVPLLNLSPDIDPGLPRVLWEDLLPELERMGLPSPATGAPPSEPTLTLVFDRESWSPEMSLALRACGVACVS